MYIDAITYAPDVKTKSKNFTTISVDDDVHYQRLLASSSKLDAKITKKVGFLVQIDDNIVFVFLFCFFCGNKLMFDAFYPVSLSLTSSYSITFVYLFFDPFRVLILHIRNVRGGIFFPPIGNSFLFIRDNIVLIYQCSSSDMHVLVFPVYFFACYNTLKTT